MTAVASPSRDVERPARPPGSRLRVAAAVLGNALEFYDFAAYAAFAVAVGRVFFPSGNQGTSLLLSVATFGVGFVARPLGGVVIGAYADRFGRRPAMTLTIALMTIGSGLIGVLPGYDAIGIAAPLLLVLARLIQGFSTGGEMGPATCYLIESAPPGRSGLLGAWQWASQSLGLVFSGIVGVALAHLLPAPAAAAWGWRVPFLLGILIAPVGFYLRRRLDETLDVEAAHGSMGGVIGDLARNHGRVAALGVLSISGASVNTYFFLYNTTFALKSLSFSPEVASASNLTLGATGVAFALLGGRAADRFGFKVTTIVPRVAVTLLLYPAVTLVVSSPSPAVFLLAMAALMALNAMSGAAGIVLLAKLFPPAVRTAGLSIAYAAGVTLFGGTAQVVFTAIIEATGSKSSWVWYVVAMNLVSVAATLLVREPGTPDAPHRAG